MSKKVKDSYPLIAFANWWQFGPRERIRHARVESRMLLWCRQGQGTVRVNAEDIVLEPGCFVFLPWAHRIAYRPDPGDPMLVGAIHMIPIHEEGPAPVFDVAHSPDHPLANQPWRRDGDFPGLPGIARGHFKQWRPLEHLAEYILLRYVERGPDAAFCRQMGEALKRELMDGATGTSVLHEEVPGQLARMAAFIEAHAGSRIALEDLAGVGRCSRATVRRLFIRHYGAPPAQYVSRYKMDRAGELLRTSRLGVGEIARRVGFEDPFHFSKTFKKLKGVGPLAYRKASRGL